MKAGNHMSVTHRHGAHGSHTHDALSYAEHQQPIDDEIVESDTRLDADLPPPEHRGRVVDGMLTAPAGWCAPSDVAGDGFVPPVTVKRGGMKWPTDEVAAQLRLERDAMQVREADRADRLKRHKEWMSTIRVLGVLFLLTLIVLARLDALPWQ
jgi:hypothetical protein